MPVVEDQLWKHPGNPGMIVVTSHATIDTTGRLLMQDGPSLEAKRRIPEIEKQCGQAIRKQAVDGVYGFLPVRPSLPDQRVIGFGLFQTRLEPDQSPDPELIRYSMDCLRQYVEAHTQLKIRMNFPGSGLSPEEVTPLLLPLPKTVTVCHQGELPTSLPENFTGFKAIYLQVERMLQENRYQQAIEYLVGNGFDLQSAMEQVNAVQRLLRERIDRDAESIQRWRSVHSFR